MKVFAVIALSLIAGSLAATLDLVGTCRDFTPSHPDFEHYLGAVSGLVTENLPSNGIPILRSSSHQTITSDASFAQWYTNVDGVNQDFTVTLTLNQVGSSNVYSYDNSDFFPLDGMGFGNYGSHNFHFTCVFRNTFTYQGGEVFRFRGDDDVWVYINGKLAIDLGGVHGAQDGQVSLDSSASYLGISVGGDYTLDIFQAERHTTQSNFKVETTIQLVASDPDPEPRVASICEVALSGFVSAHPDPHFTFGGEDYSFENFNAISFDSFSAVSGDVEGRLAVRNNLNLPSGQYSVGYELRTGGSDPWDNSLPYSVIVGHFATWTSGAVYPYGDNLPYPGAREGIFVGEDPFSASADLIAQRTGGPCASCLDSTFDSAQAYYTDLSNAFDAVPDNAAVFVQYGTLTLTCSDNTATGYSVHVDSSVFSTVTSYALVNCNTNAQIVFNIGGSTLVKFAGDNIYQRQEQVLYNILGAGRTVRVETEVRGSILAPNSQYLQPGMGVVKGHVIVGNIVQAHQINRLHCQAGTPPPPPPPSDEHYCPAYEHDCAGLRIPLDGVDYSFRDFHVISFGDFNANTGDVEGRLAVRDNANFGAGYSIGYELRTTTVDNSLPYSFVAGGNVVWPSGALFPDGSGVPYPGNQENMFVGGNLNAPSYLQDRRTGSGSLTSFFDAAHTCYQTYTNELAGHSDNVNKVIQWSGLYITCQDQDADRYYLSLTPSEMDQFTYYPAMENCNSEAEWVLNIRGSGPVFITGASFPSDYCGGVIYNIIGDRTVSVSGTSVCGHLLAPDANLNQPGGVIVGKTVAGTVSMSLQINKQNTCPNDDEGTPSRK